jgi:hypothetical protein
MFTPEMAALALLDKEILAVAARAVEVPEPVVVAVLEKPEILMLMDLAAMVCRHLLAGHPLLMRVVALEDLHLAAAAQAAAAIKIPLELQIQAVVVAVLQPHLDLMLLVQQAALAS